MFYKFKYSSIDRFKSNECTRKNGFTHQLIHMSILWITLLMDAYIPYNTGVVIQYHHRVRQHQEKIKMLSYLWLDNLGIMLLSIGKERWLTSPFYKVEIWSDTRGSNSWPQPWQGCALPTELVSHWLRGPDLNRRPSGYEPDELPSCSTPRP